MAICLFLCLQSQNWWHLPGSPASKAILHRVEQLSNIHLTPVLRALFCGPKPTLGRALSSHRVFCQDPSEIQSINPWFKESRNIYWNFAQCWVFGCLVYNVHIYTCIQIENNFDNFSMSCCLRSADVSSGAFDSLRFCRSGTALITDHAMYQRVPTNEFFDAAPECLGKGLVGFGRSVYGKFGKDTE